VATIDGTQGDDLITGTATDDIIDSDWGDDVVNAGDGNDTITDTGGSNIIDAGAGNDFIDLAIQTWGATAYAGVYRTNQVYAGDGADVVHVMPFGPQKLTIDLGAGADLLTFSSVALDSKMFVTTGAGADRIVLDATAGEYLQSILPGPIVITDFTAGAGGDILDIGEAIRTLLAWNPHADNPSADGHLVLIQDGADVVVRVDVDGFGGNSGGSYVRDVFRLLKVNVSQLTAYNFAGFAPDGSALASNSMNGTAQSEWLHADAGGSTLNGLDGDDRLIGSTGQDVLDGGAGNDLVEGSYGNDQLDGGIGNDRLDGGAGNDVLHGGDGDDILTDPSGADTIDGGAGNDVIDIIRAGDQGDLGTVTINAGDGDDFVRYLIDDFRGRDSANLVVDLGAGNDRVEIPLYLQTHLTLGAGQDRVVLDGLPSERDPSASALIITDFAAGANGDILDVDHILRFGNWNHVTNPFADGHLRLIQSGADTLVVFDEDGANGASNLYVLARLANVSASTLTAFNFGGFAPDGSTSSYVIAQATNGNDHLIGSTGTDFIDGGAGNDLIEDLTGGSDTLNGSDGDDRIRVDHFTQWGSTEVVTINGGSGRDVADVTFGSGGHFNVDLGADDDRLIIRGVGEGGADITLGAGSDVIELTTEYVSSGHRPFTVHDFTTGSGGDRLDWAVVAENVCGNGSSDYNPFRNGDARLVQLGADVQLQINESAFLKYSPGGSGWAGELFVTLVTFSNTSLAGFTAENLGYNFYFPTGVGGAGDDTLTGTAGNDVLVGAAGNDQLSGLGGDDVLRGDDGFNTLNGGPGNDWLQGGNRADTLIGGDGNDHLDGGGNGDTVDGGDGDDVIVDSHGNDTIAGGAGNDTITVNIASGILGGGGSISAGDGNDVVRITNSSSSTGYAIDLGAGDDLVHLDNPSGSLTLGAGRDTVEWTASPSTQKELVITDFATGDAGDIFDIQTFISIVLGGNTASAADLNPFAAGFFELRQNGGVVDLFVYRNGVVDAQNSQTPVVEFVNTNLSQFTAANFGGYDPHAAPVTTPNTNATTLVSGDLTINAGQVVDLLNLGSAYRFDVFAISSLTNHGQVTTRSTVDYIAPIGVEVPMGTGGASIVNAADGVFSVLSEATMPPSQNDFFKLYGVYIPGTGGFLQNDGQFQVSAAGGTAYGLFSTDAPFANTGSFAVSSGYDAYGVFTTADANFFNSGSLTVHGGDFAVGLYEGDIRGSVFNNIGTITATTDLASPYLSVGVYFSESVGNGIFHHYNSGTITADIAFWIENDHSTTLLGQDYLHNSGTINGEVILSFGDDVLDNSGTIAGTVLLGPGNDRYDGSAGLNSGQIEGGTGDDLLIGGVHDDNLFGDWGNDILSGGSGADFIDGGMGADMLDGGAGADTLSYLESLSSVTVDLAAGTASDGISTDLVRGFEQLIGSRFADNLRGSKSADSLIGGDGDDRIDGGAGNDVLWGGRGNDGLTGGSGNDTFEFNVGDGSDLIRDFAAGDAIAIYGYTAAQSVTQVGSDVKLVLSQSDQITLLNTTVASVQAALQFSAGALADLPGPRDQSIRIADDDFIIPAGVTVTLTDPDDFDYRQVSYSGQGILLTSTGRAPGFFNSGTFNYVDSGLPQVIGVSRRYDYWDEDHKFVNQATGSILIQNNGGNAIGVFDIPLTFNYGSIHVVSQGGDAYGFTDLPPSVSVFDVGKFVNAGSVTVDASGHAFGLGQFFHSTTSTFHIYNSGVFAVNGQLASVGIDWKSAGHPAQTPPFLNNSGQIVVTDATAAKDSAAVQVDWSFDAQLWNSGTLQGDYSIKRGYGFSGGPGTLSIYNSGSLIGDVDLLSYQDSGSRNAVLVNNGTIVGNVALTGFDDSFDSRQGTFTGSLYGNDGNDRLLTGAGAQSLFGGFGNDLLSGGAGIDQLTGGAGADTFRFGAGFGVDTITDFNAANGDRIEVAGYSAWQSIVQQGSDVVVTFAPGDQLVFQNQSLASINANLFTWNASAIAANIIPTAPTAPGAPEAVPAHAPDPIFPLYGTSASDTLNGNASVEVLFGLAGNDVLNAGGGNDILTGGAGVDTLTGGSGNDAFSDTAAGLSGDTITDFTTGDKIVITDANMAGFSFTLSGNTLTFTGGSLTLSSVPSGTIVAHPAVGGGVELSIFQQPANNDFNGDGLSDVLWMHDAGYVMDWLALSNGTFVGNTSLLTQVPTNWHIVGTGDFNGDYRTDVLWRSDDGTVTDWIAQPNGAFAGNSSLVTQVPTNWHIAATGDFNGDGRDDILWRSDDGTVTDWLALANGSGTFAGNSALVTQVPTNWHIAGTGDFNGDGRDDVLWRSDDGYVTDWIAQPNGTFAGNSALVTQVPTNWHIAGTGDFNGDGRDDVLWRSDDGYVTDWLGLANGAFAGTGISSLGSNWHVVQTGDFNGDGRDDVMWRSDDGHVTDWLGQADGSFLVNNGLDTAVPASWHVYPQEAFL
jgi:Ca2+-binding RTX toxin-like protein